MDEENVISNKDVIKYDIKHDIKGDIKHDIKDVITEQTNTNPWHMTSISDFLYYCCAECNFKDKIEKNFIGHATSEHPKSREIFENNQTFDEISSDNKLEENSNDESTNEDMKSDTECDNPADKKEVFHEMISQVVGEVRFKCRYCDYKRFLNFSRSLHILLMGSINQFQNYNF